MKIRTWLKVRLLLGKTYSMVLDGAAQCSEGQEQTLLVQKRNPLTVWSFGWNRSRVWEFVELNETFEHCLLNWASQNHLVHNAFKKQLLDASSSHSPLVFVAELRMEQASFHSSSTTCLSPETFLSSLLCCRLFSQKQNHVINTVPGSVLVAAPVEMIQQHRERQTGSFKAWDSPLKHVPKGRNQAEILTWKN